MNVAVVSHLFPNPEEPLKGVFVLEHALAIAQKTPTTVIAPLPYLPLFRSYKQVPSRTQNGTLLIHHPKYLALPHWLFAHRWRTYCRALRSVWDELPFQPNLLHLHWIYPDTMAALRCSRSRNFKIVATVHGLNAMGHQTSPNHRAIYGDTLRQIDQIIAVSHDLRDKLIGAFGLDPAKISVIHNGITLSKFKPGSREEARRSLGIPLNQRVIISVARLSEEKALDHLIKAFVQLKRLDLSLYLIGEGPLRPTLQGLIEQLGVDNRVFLVGGVSHELLNDWFCAADLFCLSSLHEGCPVVVHEALACGIPVVATRVGAVPDVVCSPDYGLICPPNDVPQLSHHLAEALGRNWDQMAIAEHGRQFTWEKVARETLQVYQTALA